jgi:4-aminobutyrate aminotransferase-like enzyme
MDPAEVAISSSSRSRATRLPRPKRGPLLLWCGFKAIRFLPPLDVTTRELNLALKILSGVLLAV